ncbi:MAG: hypothetical protein MUP11_11600 [Anaerolineales bacterium]|nr:hypothetical protein [Anaerolineales bacterium]
MTVQVGEKLHIITRRLFEGDLRRHFAGVVEEVTGTIIRVRGYVFVFDEGVNEFVRRNEERRRLFSVSDAGLVINILPLETEVEDLRYKMNDLANRVLTDGKTFSLNISEFSSTR